MQKLTLHQCWHCCFLQLLTRRDQQFNLFRSTMHSLAVIRSMSAYHAEEDRSVINNLASTYLDSNAQAHQVSLPVCCIHPTLLDSPRQSRALSASAALHLNCSLARPRSQKVFAAFAEPDPRHSIHLPDHAAWPCGPAGKSCAMRLRNKFLTYIQGDMWQDHLGKYTSSTCRISAFHQFISWIMVSTRNACSSLLPSSQHM